MDNEDVIKDVVNEVETVNSEQFESKINPNFRKFLSNIETLHMDDEEEDDDEDDEDDDDDDDEYDDDDDEEDDDFNNEFQADENNEQVIIDNFNETTSKYLNMLGEDLLMEEQDILVGNKAFKTIKKDSESNDETVAQNEYFDDRFKIGQVDLMSVVEQLNKTIETERSEKNRLKIRLNNLIQENKNKSSLLTQYEIERNELIKELNNVRTIRSKESKRLNAEVEAISREYSQIMSERDMVHKEMEALQEQLSKAQDRLKKHARESVVLSGQNDSIHNYNELNLTGLANMSVNLNETNANELNTSTSRQQKVNSVMFGYSSIMDESLEIDSLRQQINMLTKQRDDAVNQIKELYYQMGKNPDQIPDYNNSEYVDRFLAERIINNNVNSNPNNPEYENEKLKFELKELCKEIENAKKRRDMAFNERDKMLKERESIRGLCDDMRHQRDKAISELAEAISETDELRKQKNLAYRQIQVLEKNLAIMEEKLAFIREMNELKEEEEDTDKQEDGGKSFDSDDLNWKTLRVDIDLIENTELGIELAYASKIIEKLEVNDELDKSINELNQIQLNMSPKLENKNTKLNIYDEHSLENKSVLSAKIENIAINNKSEDDSTKNDVNQYDELTQLENDEGDEDTFKPTDKLSSDELILISDVDENGLASGKLKVFDRLLKINDVDVQKLSADEIKQMIFDAKNTISFIISRHFGKSTDCMIRKSSDKHLNLDTKDDDEDIDEEIISTSMSLITTSSSHSNQPNPSKNPPNKTNSYGSNDDSTFKFDRTDVNRYSQNKKDFLRRRRVSNASSENTLDMISMNKGSLNDLLLETGVYVSNIVRKHNAELSVGDQILSINGHSLTNKTLYEIMDMINQVNHFKLVVKKCHKMVPSKPAQVSRNRGFIVMSQSNLSISSVSVLNQTIRDNDIKTNLKSSSNLIFNIKDQKELRKQIESNNNMIKTAKPIVDLDLAKHQKQCKKYYAKALANIEQKEQDLLGENLVKYQELIKNFHSQSRKGNQLFVDIDVQEAGLAGSEKPNSKNSLFKFHKTSPHLVDEFEPTYMLNTSNTSGNEAPNQARISSKRFRQTNPQNDAIKFNYRRSAQVQDNNNNNPNFF